LRKNLVSHIGILLGGMRLLFPESSFSAARSFSGVPFVRQLVQQNTFVVFIHKKLHWVNVKTNVAIVSHVFEVAVVYDNLSGFEVYLVPSALEVMAIFLENPGHARLKSISGGGTFCVEFVIGVLYARIVGDIGGQVAEVVVSDRK
jgi:hypothetical protein